MAIRFIEKNNAWQVYWRDPFTNKQVSRNFVSEKEAKKENDKILYRLRYDRDSFKADPIQDKTLNDLYLEYIQVKQFDTYQQYRCKWNLQYILDTLGNKRLYEISKTDIIEIKEHFLCNTELSSTSIHHHLSTFRTLLYFAREKGYIADFKFPHIPSPKYQRFIPPNLDELERLLDVSPSHLQRVIILGAFFGVRVGQSELFQLTWQDVDFSRQVLRIHGSNKNKNSPWREVPIKESLLSTLGTWCANDTKQNIIYIINYQGKAVKSIKRAWSTALKKANINRNIRPYDLRHTFGTELVAAGVDIGTVANLMGHSSPIMLLKHYQYILDKQKKQAIESLPTLTI